MIHLIQTRKQRCSLVRTDWVRTSDLPMLAPCPRLRRLT